LLLFLSAILRPAPAAGLDTDSIKRSTNDMITDAGKILHPAATN
jgi:hypothetical protein